MTKRRKSPTSSMAFEQAEKACSKVIYAGETLIDLTADTVSAEHLEEGYTAHDRAGNSIVGTLQVAKSVQQKDINFYDYDGTLVDSWTFDELYTRRIFHPIHPMMGLLHRDGTGRCLI